MEALIPKLYGKEATEIPGARMLLNKIINARVPWGIVTSGSATLATGWLDVMGFPRPKDMITAESVEHGMASRTRLVIDSVSSDCSQLLRSQRWWHLKTAPLGYNLQRLRVVEQLVLSLAILSRK